MELTDNFDLEEFIKSKFYDETFQKEVWNSYEADKTYLLPNLQKLANQLQVLREYLGVPVKINIAYRPEWYEQFKGRNGNSRHCHGLAADIIVEDMSPREVADTIEVLIKEGKMLQGGLGRYSSFTHYDIGYNNKKRRWNG